jgi:hypothetical protein
VWERGLPSEGLALAWHASPDQDRRENLERRKLDPALASHFVEPCDVRQLRGADALVRQLGHGNQRLR